jgi:hypothetical protein
MSSVLAKQAEPNIIIILQQSAGSDHLFENENTFKHENDSLSDCDRCLRRHRKRCAISAIVAIQIQMVGFPDIETSTSAWKCLAAHDDRRKFGL